jgi:hypothetical protein
MDATILVAIIGAGATITAALVSALKGRTRKKLLTHTAFGLKYFHYISRQKVEQIRSQLGLVDTLDQQTDLPRQALESVVELEKRGQITSMDQGAPLESGVFLRSISSWRHGLFYFRSSLDDHTAATYVAWRECGRSLILLVGSPNNILGEQVAREGLVVPGSSGALSEIFALLDSMRAEEPQYVESRLGPAVKIQGGHEEHYGVCWQYTFGARSRALSLATLCFGYFGTLPQARLEVLFRLFSKHPATKSSIYEDLRTEAFDALIYPAFTVDDFRARTKTRNPKTGTWRVEPKSEDTTEATSNWERVYPAVKSFQFQKYDTVWVGSPLYVALM